ncbi:MAG: methyltransferase [Rhodospirillaceae bacterium]|nr:methyltransferase [Rhodospirillaceae bacterium]
MGSTKAIDDYAASLPIANIKIQDRSIRYGVPNQQALWRVSTFHTKEPETVRWITKFKADSVFLDVGANMGLYSMLAAVYSKARVFAFEPESQNYALLNKNISLNKMSDRVIAWCCALSDMSTFDRLYMTGLNVASSGHEFGAEVDHNLMPVKARFAQGSMSSTIDTLIQSKTIPVPNHIKIDVDGIEHLVVKGGMNVLQKTELQSVLIEINPHLMEHSQLVADMLGIGFDFDPAQVERARRKEGSTKDYAEYIFWRK